MVTPLSLRELTADSVQCSPFIKRRGLTPPDAEVAVDG